jgi:glutamate synthase (NADPH/NADH) small chain
VAGSGPAGLAVADTLNRAGCNVTVFDNEPKAGGVLRYGIPDFKLEKSVIDRRINLMKEEGVSFELGATVGRDISCKYLRDRFDVICLTGGSRKPRDLNVPGRELKGIHFALPYLAQQNRVVSGEIPAASAELDAKGRHVVVIGGGDTGSDCVGTALRQGALSVLQLEIMPKPPEDRPESTPWPTWPNILRTSGSQREGGERRWSVRTTAFVGKAGCVSSLLCVEVEWTTRPDRSAGFADKPRSEFSVNADVVLLAMGFTGPEGDSLVEELGLARSPAGNIAVDERHMTSVKGVFAAGDMSRGQSLVVRAIKDGREAATSILEYLGKEKMP